MITVCFAQVGTTCTFFLSENIPVAVDMLRHLASGVLCALQYLHDNNIVHRDLRDTSVHIDRTGVVKVSDYSLDKRLSDIYRSSSLAKAEHDFPTVQGRGGKKADIYRFGILLVSLFRGALVSENDTGWDVNMQVKNRTIKWHSSRFDRKTKVEISGRLERLRRQVFKQQRAISMVSRAVAAALFHSHTDRPWYIAAA